MAQYIKDISIKESKFGLKLSGKTDSFINQIKSITNEKGYFNLEINPRKEKGKYGETHSCKVDEWKPDPNYKSSQGSGKTEVKQEETPPEDDLPFA